MYANIHTVCYMHVTHTHTLQVQGSVRRKDEKRRKERESRKDKKSEERKAKEVNFNLI
jgi:hypothetical protein